MQRFNPRRGMGRLLCPLLAALTVLGPTTLATAQQTFKARQGVVAEGDTTLLAGEATQPADLDLAFVLPEAVVVIAARPGQLLNSAANGMLPVEVLRAAMVKEWGLDPVDAQQLVVSVAPPTNGPPNFAIHTKFNQPIKLKEGELTRHTEPAKLAGKSYYKSKQPMAPSLISPTPDSLLAAPDYALPQLLEDGDVQPGNLATQLAEMDDGDDLLALIDVATLRPLIFMGLGQADVPPEAQRFLQAFNFIKQIEARVNLSHSADSELIVTANSEADAERLLGLVDDAKKLVKDRMAPEVERALQSDDPVEQAAGRYSQRMSKMWDEHLKLERDGDQIVIVRGNVAENGLGPASVAAAGVVTALLLPAVQAARSAAQRNASMNNIKQIMLGLLNFESARGAMPAHAVYSDDGKPLLSWRVQILPYIEQQELYNQFHLDEPWDSEHNKQLLARMPEIYRDPASKLTAADGKSNYLGVTGEGALFDGTEKGRGFREITDGTSNTIAVVQVGDKDAVIWTKPDDYKPADTNLLDGRNTLRPGGFLAGFCDGHVSFISSGVDAETFKGLLTVGGGEVVNDY
jgi:hypothetical protein